MEGGGGRGNRSISSNPNVNKIQQLINNNDSTGTNLNTPFVCFLLVINNLRSCFVDFEVVKNVCYIELEI